MKIIFLNAWNGRVRTEISEYIKQQSSDTDIFCFQEDSQDMQQLARDILPGYQVIAAASKQLDSIEHFDQFVYAKPGVEVVSTQTLFQDDDECGLVNYLELRVKGQTIHLCNVHGRSRPVHKLDTPGRLKLSRALIGLMAEKPGLKIIGGDFNILPETQSIQLFAQNGYRDLIADFKIPTTRNHYIWDRYPDKMYYSDYVFVSQDAAVKHFEVPANEISDHLPLILEIGLKPAFA